MLTYDPHPLRERQTMKLLDLYCGAGGCAVGYHRTGFTEIVGVDIVCQPRYPFQFVRADALEYLKRHGHEFDFIHASPPCQKFAATHVLSTKEHPDLIAATRWQLEMGMGYLFPLCIS